VTNPKLVPNLYPESYCEGCNCPSALFLSQVHCNLVMFYTLCALYQILCATYFWWPLECLVAKCGVVSLIFPPFWHFISRLLSSPLLFGFTMQFVLNNFLHVLFNRYRYMCVCLYADLNGSGNLASKPIVFIFNLVSGIIFSSMEEANSPFHMWMAHRFWD